MSNIFFKLHCPDCGKSISDTDILCPHCGANLDAPLEKAELEALAQQCLEIAKKALESNRDLNGALVNCNQAIEYIPKSAEAHNLRGLILDAMGKTNESILAYQEAVRLNPDFDDAKENLATAKTEYQSNQQKDSNGASIQQKSNMTKRKAIILAAFTAWPFLYMIAGICISILAFPFGNNNSNNFYGNLPPSLIPIIFRVFIPIHIATLLEMLALLVYYILHLSNTTAVAASKKVLWAVILILSNPLFLPVYWYLYIWKPLPSEASA